MSETINVDQAFDPEARKAQAEFDAYMESRPYMDANGSVHNPENGQFANPDKYFDAVREDSESASLQQDAYEDKGMVELARELGQAELNKDKTTENNVLDSLLTKIDEHVAKGDESSSNREEAMFDKDGKPVDMHDVWLNKLLAVKDKFKQDSVTAKSKSPEDPKPRSEVIELENPKSPEKEPYFKPGQTVFVKRTAGQVESGWETGRTFVDDDGIEVVHVHGTEIVDGQEKGIYKTVPVEDLKHWQEQEEIRDRVNANVEASRAVRAARNEARAEQTDDLPVVVAPAEVVKTQEGRVKGAFKRAKNKLGKLYAAAGVGFGAVLLDTKSYFTDPEHGKERQKRAKIIGAAAGALALVGTAYLLIKGLDGGGSKDAHSVVPKKNPSIGGEIVPKGNANVTASTEVVNHAHEQLNHAGDTIWNHASNDLISKGVTNPSPAQIQAETQRILDLNHINWDQARQLPIDYDFLV